MTILDTYLVLYFISVIFMIHYKDMLIELACEKRDDISRDIVYSLWEPASIFGSLLLLGIFIMLGLLYGWILDQYINIRCIIIIWKTKRVVKKICDKYNIKDPFNERKKRPSEDITSRP